MSETLIEITEVEVSTPASLTRPSVDQPSASRPRLSSPLELSTPQRLLMIALVALVGFSVFSSAFGRADRRDLIDSPRDSALAAPIQIHLNSAAESELNLLPGIGEKMAGEMIAARNRIGGFRTWDDITSISGMGPATVAAIRPWCDLSPIGAEPLPESLAVANH